MSSNPVLVATCCLLLAVVVTGVRGDGDTIPDAEIGLREAGVLETPTPEPTRPNQSFPGEVTPPGAPFPEGPPPVSHGVIDFLPITFDRNDCVDCHAVDEKVEGEATPIPVSHYTDLRGGSDEVQEEVVGARYLCTSCHVSPGENTSLVDNHFDQ